MSTSQSQTTAPALNAKVSQPVFLGILWAFTGLSFLFICFRLLIRLATYRRLFVDDFFVFAAWIILIATAIIWQIEAPVLYQLYLVNAGKAPFTPDFENDYSHFMKLIAPMTILFYSCLWLVKFSFLAFFSKLGSKIQSHRIWWWVVLIVTIGVWIASVADLDYKCSLSALPWILANCPTLARIHYQNRTFYANCAGDVVTDLLILSVPVLILWSVRVPLRKKLILLGIFSVTVLVMAVAIIRVAVVHSANTSADISWLYFWSFIEMGTAIIVSCIASFRQLFVSAQNQHLYGSSSEGKARISLFKYFRSDSSGFSSKPSSRPSRKPWGMHQLEEDSSSQKSETHILPLDSVRVRNDIYVVKTAAEESVPQGQHMV